MGMLANTYFESITHIHKHILKIGMNLKNKNPRQRSLYTLLYEHVLFYKCNIYFSNIVLAGLSSITLTYLHQK